MYLDRANTVSTILLDSQFLAYDIITLSACSDYRMKIVDFYFRKGKLSIINNYKKYSIKETIYYLTIYI